MLNLLWYMLMGTGAFVILAVDILIAVKSNGWSVMAYLEWFDETNSRKLRDVSVAFAIFEFLWGLMLWPLRVLESIPKSHAMITAYSKYINNLKEE